MTFARDTPLLYGALQKLNRTLSSSISVTLHFKNTVKTNQNRATYMFAELRHDYDAFSTAVSSGVELLRE